MFKELQVQHKVWALRNFGEQDIESYSLGLIEEVGELAHSVLKRKQGIRNNEDHDALIKDAVGDIVIYLAGYCNVAGIDLDNKESFFIFEDKVKSISLAVSNLLINNTTESALLIVHKLGNFCETEGIDFRQTVLSTWEDVVSKRDWIENPDQCETEDPRYQGFPV